MSKPKLDEIFRVYRETCFTVRDNKASDKAIDLLAHQNILTKTAVKDFIKELGADSLDINELLEKVDKL